MVDFKDADNIQHNLSKNIPITIYLPMDAARLNGGASGGATTSAAAAARSRGGLFGFSYLEIGIALVVIVAAYFGYRKWKGTKK